MPLKRRRSGPYNGILTRSVGITSPASFLQTNGTLNLSGTLYFPDASNLSMKNDSKQWPVDRLRADRGRNADDHEQHGPEPELRGVWHSSGPDDLAGRVDADHEGGIHVKSRRFKRLARLVCSNTGSALVELAMCLPLLVLILVGTADFARVFYTSIALTNAARAGAQAGAYSLAQSDPVTGPMVATANSASNVTPSTVTASRSCVSARATMHWYTVRSTACCRSRRPVRTTRSCHGIV